MMVLGPNFGLAEFLKRMTWNDKTIFPQNQEWSHAKAKRFYIYFPTLPLLIWKKREGTEGQVEIFRPQSNLFQVVTLGNGVLTA